MMWLTFRSTIRLATLHNGTVEWFLHISSNKYAFFFLSPRGLITLFVVNAFIISSWAFCQYFATWPSDELINYLKTPMLEMKGADLSSTAFMGFCGKVRFIGNLRASQTVPICRKLWVSDQFVYVVAISFFKYPAFLNIAKLRNTHYTFICILI